MRAIGIAVLAVLVGLLAIKPVGLAAEPDQRPHRPAFDALLRNLSSPNTTRYQKSACGAIIDSNSNLQWYIGPDTNVTWKAADNWVKQLNACGGGWKLPSVSQLKTLYDPHVYAGIGYFSHGKHWPAHINPAFSGIGHGSWVWADGVAGLNAPAINFNQGIGVRLPLDPPYPVRVFAVKESVPQSSTTAAPPPASASNKLTSHELEGFIEQITKCWHIPSEARGRQDLVVDIKVEVNRDGTVTHAEIVHPARYAGNSLLRAIANSALRAVTNRACQPLRLPPSKYAAWHYLVLSFNPADVLGRQKGNPRSLTSKTAIAATTALKQLNTAITDKDVAGVERAISEGADPNGLDGRGECVLIRAVEIFGPIGRRMTQALLRAGARTGCRYHGRTALHLVSDPKITEILIKAGADINARDDSGNTPLHLAVKDRGDIESSRELIEAGAKNLWNKEGYSPLDLAIIDMRAPALVALLRTMPSPEPPPLPQNRLPPLKGTYTNPFAYCRAVGTLDWSDSYPGYTGPMNPPALIAEFHIPSIPWRCAGGSVYVCNIVGDHQCAKLDISRTPNEGIRQSCQRFPNSQIAAVYLGNSAYKWRCQGTIPIIVLSYPVDHLGYRMGAWFRATP